MRVWIALSALLVLFPAIVAGAAENKRAPTTAKTARIEPPVAARKPVRLRNHGIVRVDNYAWLRDKNWREVVRDSSRLAPAIRAYLTAENRYADAVQAPLAGLRARLVAEMKGRLQPQDTGVPMPDGPYAYWRKFVAGAEYIVHVRAPRDGGDEEVLVDGNVLAKGRPYFAFGDTRIHSPDHRYFAYTFDDSGSESYTLVVRDLAAKRDLPDVIKSVSNFTWADSNVIYYVRQDDELRARFVYRHRLGTDPANDTLVYEENDLQFSVSVGRTNSGRFVVISAASSDTSEARIVETAKPESEPRLVEARTPGLMYGIDDGGDQLIVLTNADGAEDYKIMTAPLATPGREHWRDLVPYREGRRIESVEALANHLVRLERENGLGRIVIRRKADGAEHAVSFDAEAYDIELTHPLRVRLPDHPVRLCLAVDAAADLRLRPGDPRTGAAQGADASGRPRSRRLCGAAAVRHDRRQGRGAGHAVPSERSRRSTARRRCSSKATAPTPTTSRPRSTPTSCRWSIAASSTPSRMSVAASRRASAGATPGAARTRSTPSRISSPLRSISSRAATPRAGGSWHAAIPPAGC